MKFFPDNCGHLTQGKCIKMRLLWLPEGQDMDLGLGRCWCGGCPPAHACICTVHSSMDRICPPRSLPSLRTRFLCARVSTLLSGLETLLYSSTVARGRHWRLNGWPSLRIFFRRHLQFHRFVHQSLIRETFCLISVLEIWSKFENNHSKLISFQKSSKKNPKNRFDNIKNK